METAVEPTPPVASGALTTSTTATTAPAGDSNNKNNNNSSVTGAVATTTATTTTTSTAPVKFSREPPALTPEAMAALVVEYERVLEALADADLVGPNETPANSAPGARLLHVLDVREPTETALGTISRAVLIPRAHSLCAASEYLISVLS